MGLKPREELYAFTLQYLVYMMKLAQQALYLALIKHTTTKHQALRLLTWFDMCLLSA